MEFFEHVENSKLDKERLKQLLSIERLPALCASINSVISDEGETGVIYCLWGEFGINREELEYGVRFSLPKCPNALAWSITTDEDYNHIIIHCTINRKEQEQDLIDSILQFVGDWSKGIKTALCSVRVGSCRSLADLG